MLTWIVWAILLVGPSRGDEVSQAIATVREASPTKGADDDIRKAWKVLADADADRLPTILRAMENANPAALNWLRTAADTVAERTLAADAALPREELTKLIGDPDASPHGRRVAYEWLEEVDPREAQRLLAKLINDPSLELRYDAIAAAIVEAKQAADDVKAKRFRGLIKFARDVDQIKACKAQLEEAGEKVDVPKLMGFITTWRVIGPFDNSRKSGFDVAYPPEREIDFSASYDGKDQVVTWSDAPVISNDDFGKIDLAEVLGPLKGAVAYAYGEVEAPQARKAFVRYGSPNATKLWINGKLVATNEVYHAGSGVDQYVVPVELKSGGNTILLKICQDERTEPAAQVWMYQLRITDELGGPITRDIRSAESSR